MNGNGAYFTLYFAAIILDYYFQVIDIINLFLSNFARCNKCINYCQNNQAMMVLYLFVYTK